MQYQLYYSTSFNPFENMALESYFLERKKMQENERIIYLWNNRPSLFMGRFQNPWKEINIEKAIEDSIPVFRRRSGGGCVFHDEGNLNISIISKDWRGSSYFVKLLQELQINAILGEKGDILVCGKKCSGSAYYHHKNALLHHFTLLFNSNVDNLYAYLNSPFQNQIETKATASRKAVVANLQSFGLSQAEFFKALCKSIQTNISMIESPIKCMGTNFWEQFCQEYYTAKWIYEKTPPFLLKNPCDQDRLMIPSCLHS